MSEINPMEEVIEDAVNDSLDTTPVDTSTDVVDTTSELSADSTDSTITDSTDVQDPLADPAAVQDDFEKEWGIPARSITGRENRVPHARVKTMVTKAEQKGYDKAKKELDSQYTPKVTEYEAKVKDYEGRLGKVAQFEQVLENDPRTFLQLLSQIPAYKEFFDYVGKLAQGQGGQQPQAAEQPYLDSSTMPQPDQILSDGSKVYSLEGLAKRDEWLAKQIEGKVVQQAEDRMTKRYAPMEQEWQNQQRTAQLVPVIERQIAEARTWPNFQELEPTIVQKLKSDHQMTLDRAYVLSYQEQVVPKVSADRNKIRTELLAELRQKPVSSSAPASQVRPSAPSTL